MTCASVHVDVSFWHRSIEATHDGTAACIRSNVAFETALTPYVLLYAICP